MKTLTVRERQFWDAVNAAEAATKEQVAEIAQRVGFTWGECARLSTEKDGLLGKRSHLLRQVRNGLKF